MTNFKSQKQIDSEKNELIKELKKQNSEMLEMLLSIYQYSKLKDGKFTFTASEKKLTEIEQLIKSATEL